MASVFELRGKNTLPFYEVLLVQPTIVFCIVLAYCLPGLIGHEPWKPDEGYIFAGIFHMLQSGDWVVPYLAGEPFMEKPPLYHWVAASTAILAGPFLPLHDGARLASGVFIGITLWATALASRIAWGNGQGRIAILVMLGTLGLLNTIPLMLPDLPLLAGFALATLGFVAYAFERKWAFLAIGTGIGAGFLAKGLLAPGVIAIAAIALPACFKQWRVRSYARALTLAVLVALPWLVIWPALLYEHDQRAFVTWFWDNNVGRFLGSTTSQLGAATEPGFWLKTFPWFIFPWWIFVAVGVWKARTLLMRDAGMQIGLVISLSLVFVLSIAGSARVIYALPMLPALALATVGALQYVSARLWKVLAGFGIVIATAAATLAWFLWTCLTFSGHAPEWQWIARSLPLEFSLPLSFFNVGAALLVTAGWCAIVWRRRHAAHGSLIVWTASLAVSWALPVLLLLPWVDAAKSYRSVYEAMGRALPTEYSCIQSEQLGESERGILHYTLGIVTVRKEISGESSCPLLIRQLKHPFAVPPPTDEWMLLWSGSRLGSATERFELYASRSSSDMP